MSWAEVVLLLLGIPLALIAVGYGLAGRSGGTSAADRIALALLAGLAALLFSVAIVNAVLPLRGLGAALCLAPWLLGLGRRGATQLAADMRSIVRCRGAWAFGVAAGVFQLALVWPLWSNPGLVFYDGSANHDAFFWITGAEHLKRFDYLTAPAVDPSHPLFYSTTAIVGYAPVWGRMGTEGLLALVATVCGLSPLKIFVVASAALFLPWLAAQWLLVRTLFPTASPARWAWVLPLVQPMFVFFHANANTPNLVGALMGALVTLALLRLGEAASPPRVWAALLALSVHGLLCSYPEMVPAVAAPCLLLLARAAWQRRPVRPILLAIVGGMALNPLTTMRAWNGFFCSLAAAHPGHIYAGIFDKLPNRAAQLVAGSTLSLSLADTLPALIAVLLVAFLAAAAVIALTRARDAYGALALLAGFAVMAGYATWAHFNYGWQKSVQFSALAIATWLSAALLVPAPSGPGIRGLVARGLTAVLASLLVAATAANLGEAYKWSRRKNLSTEWFEARAYSHAALRDTPVLVDAGDFKWPFFYTMWSTYFLRENPIVFGRDTTAGGYLRGDADRAPHVSVDRPRVKLLGSLGSSPGAGLVWRGQQLGFRLLPRPAGER